MTSTFDFSVLDDLRKKGKKSNRFITCSICGKTITKKSMVRHFFVFHHGAD
jgi:ribosomal protein S26